MRTHHFALATVLRIRRLQESLASEQFMLAQRDVRAAEDARHVAELRLAGLAPLSEPTSIEEVLGLSDHAGRLASDLHARQRALEIAVDAREEARDRWRAARVRASALERLEAKSLARWAHDVQRHEVSEMDDLANARHTSRGVPA